MPADRVKGITIEIGGDTTALSKSLSGVNKEISSTQKQLKDVERLLKLDPTNTELLAQKQRLLKEAVSETKDKLDTLKEAEKQVQQQFKEGKVSQDQYDSIKREVIETEQQLEKVEDQLYETNKAASELHQTFNDIKKGAENVADAAGKISDKLDKASGAIAPVSAAVTGVGVYGIKTISDMDSAVGSFISKTGEAAETTDYWKSAMEDIYKSNYGSDFEDIADAMSSVKRQIKDIGKEDMVSLTEDAFTLRDAFGYDVAESVRSAKAMIDNFGIDGKRAFELIAAGAQNGLDYSGELLDSINEYSVQFAKVGFDADDMFRIFSAGAKNGAFNLDKIGDAIKEFSIRSIDGSETTKAGFDAIGVSASDMAAKFAAGGEDAKSAFLEIIKGLQGLEDPIAQNEAGVNLFGTMWEDLGPTAVLALGDISDAAYDASGALAQIQEAKYDNLSSDLQTIGREITTDIVVPILEELMPSIEMAVEKIKDFITKFSGMSEEGKNFALAVGIIIAVMPGLLKVLSLVSSGVGAISNAISFLIKNPIALVIAAIVALVLLIATKGDEIKALLQKVDDFLQNVFATDWTKIFGPVLGEALNSFFANIKNIWDSVKKIFDGIIDFIRGVFTGDWERAWTGVKEIFGGIFDGLKAVAKAPLNGIISLVNTAISGINGVIKLLNKIPGVDIGEIGKIPYLAKGGVVTSGRAIVGEAGPELLTVSGGKTIVQPLTNNTTHNTSLGGVNVYVYGAPGQDVNELADAVAERIEDIAQRKDAVFA